MGASPKANPTAAVFGEALNWSQWLDLIEMYRWTAGSNCNGNNKNVIRIYEYQIEICTGVELRFLYLEASGAPNF